jgi:predicted nucleotidyltransferase
MRLSSCEAERIRECVQSFDPAAQILLFGSRADDSRRGGDIDLLIVSRTIDLRQRLRLQSRLEDALGLQRIDLVVSPNVESDPFAKFVAGRGVYL